MALKPEIHQSFLRAFDGCPAKARLMLDGVKGHVVPLFEYGSRLHEHLYAYGDACQQKGVERDDEWADAFASITDDQRLARAISQFPLTVIIRPEFEVQGLEHSFSVEQEHCIIAGRLDRLEYDSTQALWRVIDYKSGYKPLVQQEAPRQLMIYAAAVNELLGKPGDTFEMWFVYPEANSALPPSRWAATQEDLADVLVNVDRAWVGISEMTRFEPMGSQHACAACPYLMSACPYWDCPEGTMPVITSLAMAEWAWQVRLWADAAVKEWAKDNGAVNGYTYVPPNYVEDGLTHWSVPSTRSKAGKQNLNELLRTIYQRAVTGKDLLLSQALKLNDRWLNKVMADEESELAQLIRPHVEPIAPAAEFREHLGGEE